MPRLAEKYDNYYSNYQYRTHMEYSSKSAYYDNSQRVSYVRTKNKPKRKLIQKFKTLVASSILIAAIMLLACSMSFTFKTVTKAIFIPTPYKNITTDLRQLSFPTYNYLSNAWFMGERSFRFAATGKKAQMVELKEVEHISSLQSSLNKLIESFPTIDPGIYVWDYSTGNYVDINASKVFPTASVIKIPVLIDVFKSIEAGQFALDDRMPLTEYYRTEGSGSLQFKAANSTYSIDELARRMITESDNSSTNMLMAKVGSMTDVNQAIRDWGIKNTEVQTWLPDYAGNNHSTPRDLATMLYNIDENDKFLTPQSKSKIFNYMANVHNNRLIQAGLGPDTIFLHKTGDIGKVLADAGIVITPSGKKYIVVIFAGRPHNSPLAKEFIVRASEIIYNNMVR